MADGKQHVAIIMICFSDRVEYIVEKEKKNPGYQHFLLLPQHLQNFYEQGLLKSAMNGKGKEVPWQTAVAMSIYVLHFYPYSTFIT